MLFDELYRKGLFSLKVIRETHEVHVNKLGNDC